MIDAKLWMVIVSLDEALRKLSFCAQTTGGTAGPDKDLMEAIREAEKARALVEVARVVAMKDGPND